MNQSISAYGNWVYPTLPLDDLLSCVNELHINMTMDELLRPTAGKMQFVYTAFAELILGMTPAYFDAAVEACELEVDHPDIHAEGFLFLAFFKQVRRLMIEVGYPQFAIQDLLKPETKRIQHSVSAIINLAKFREENLPVYEAFQAKAADHAERHELALQRNKELKRQVEAARVQAVTDAPLVAEVKAVNAALTADLYELKKVENQAATVYDQVKVEKAELSERLHQTQILLQNTERDVAKVKSRIVHSPEQLKQALLDMSASLKLERQTLTNKANQKRELLAKIDVLSQLEQEVLSCVKVMEFSAAEMEKVESHRQKQMMFEENVAKQKLEVREYSFQQARLQRLLVNGEDKVARATRQLDAKRDAMRARMAKSHEEREIVQEERTRIDNEMDKKRALIEATETKMAALRESLQAEVDAVNSEFAHLVQHVDYYMGEIGQAMQQSAIAV